MSAYLTAVQERNLVAKFRRHLIALSPGSRVEWRDIDAWAKANYPISVWVVADRAMIPLADYWDDLCIECMGISGKLEKEGWLAFLRFDSEGRGVPDYYYRTDKTESEPWD
jgi:hypothetical protein